MQPQKNLSNEQRKILTRIYKQQFEDVSSTYNSKRREEYSKLQSEVEADLQAKAASNPAALAMVKKAQAFTTEFNKTSKQLEKLGIEISGIRTDRADEIRIRFDSYGWASKNEALQAHQDTTIEARKNQDRAWLEVEAKIWGMDTTYAEIVKEVEAVIASIK